MLKTCFSCRHYPNEEHCHGCGWDGQSQRNTHWEPKEELDFISPKSVVGKMINVNVLDKIRTEIETDYSHTFNDGCINKNYVLSVIDKYMKK